MDGVQPYFVGKPNPLMMRSALNQIDAHSSGGDVGDRMDRTSFGLEAGCNGACPDWLHKNDEVERFPFRPSRVVDSIANLIDELE